MKQLVQMKAKIISKVIVGLSLVFVLGSAVTQVRSEDDNFPVMTIHSAGDVTRGKTGSFVLDINPALMFGAMYVNFKVSGTAVAGVDYVALVSPAYIGQSGYATILVKTLPNPRAGSSNQAYSVVVTLEPGAGYAPAVQRASRVHR